MIELWGERNVARLARESGVPRESVSKILGHKRGLGEEVAPKLARPLELDPSVLLPPPSERVTLQTILRRLDEVEASLEERGQIVADALDRVTTLLERLVAQARLDTERAKATE